MTRFASAQSNSMYRTSHHSALYAVLCAALTAAPSVTHAQAAPPAQTGTPVVAPAVPQPTLAQIPGVTVRYYDVSGTTIPALRASIEAQRPKDATGKAIPATATWSIATNVRRATLEGKCKVTGATVRFTAQAELPRLVSTEGVPAPVLQQWQTYVAGLEAQQVANLRRPYDRLPEVERAVMASTCEGASAAANRAIQAITAAPPPPAVPSVAPPPPQQ